MVEKLPFLVKDASNILYISEIVQNLDQLEGYSITTFGMYL